VKRLIRNRNTGLYFSRDGAWTDDWQQAKGFAAFGDAWAEKEAHHLGEIDLVLVVGDQPSAQYDVILPLSEEPSQSKCRGNT